MITQTHITLMTEETSRANPNVPEDFADQAIRNSTLKGKPFRMDVDRGPA